MQHPRLRLATDSPQVTVVVPVYNGSQFVDRCLGALSHTEGVTWECIVVDDGSIDGSAELARRWGARVVRSDRPRSGPGLARNLGARFAEAPLLVFLDVDVVVRSDTLARFVELFEADASLTAAFGSYDSEPDVREHLSQYRNLLHHFVHQEGHEAASTFWAGCGAIRRDAFLAIGGFNPAYQRPSIEDIELGYRLRAAGGQIRLAKYIQVKHLKRWTLLGILKTDIFDRALPWTWLIASTGRLPNDLNLQASSRASAFCVYALLGLLLVAPWQPLMLLAAVAPLTALFVCNRSLYRFFLAERGPGFLLAALPLHWMYYGYSALAFATGMTASWLILRERRHIGLSVLPPLAALDLRRREITPDPAIERISQT